MQTFEMILAGLYAAGELCYGRSVSGGWWHNIDNTPKLRDRGEMFGLMHSEISEALEGERRGLMDDKLPHRIMAEVEMADAAVRLFDYVHGFGYEIIDDLAIMLDIPLSAIENFDPGKTDAVMETMRRGMNAVVELAYAHAVSTGKYVRVASKVNEPNLASLLDRIHSAISRASDLQLAGKRQAETTWLARTLVLIFEYCGYRNFDLGGAMVEKMEFNRTRKDHTREARAAAGGKAW